MSNPEMILDIKKTASVPVMAKCRIGHFAEAQILEELEIDFIDESEVLTPADNAFHVDKSKFKIPFVCGARNLGEALRRIDEGAAMIRTKGEAGSGNIVEAVKHMRAIMKEISDLSNMVNSKLSEYAKEVNVPIDIVEKTKNLGKLPVPNFSAGGIATPADASLMMQLGAESVFVGSGIFKSKDPSNRAKAIVDATTNYKDSKIVMEASKKLKDAMKGLDISEIPDDQMFQERGW